MRGKLLLGAVLLLALALQVLSLIPVSVKADDTITDALSRAKAWLDAAYYQVSSNMAVVRDYPSVPIILEWNGQRYMAGGFLDKGDEQFKCEPISTHPDIEYKLYFNLDNQGDYDVVLDVVISNVDYYRDKIKFWATKIDVSNVRVYLGDWDLGYLLGPYVYYNKIIDVRNLTEWSNIFSNRYVLRHATWLGSWIYEEWGELEKAAKLRMACLDAGFLYDIYAPMFLKDVEYQYPDDWYLNDYTWFGYGYDYQPWYQRLYPYKSKLYFAREDPTGEGLWDVVNQSLYDAPYVKLMRAIHLLNKYGASRHDEAEQLILEAMEEGEFDGYGFKKQPLYVYGHEFPLKIPRPSYQTYITACLLGGLVRFYQVTGDNSIGIYDVLALADRLAGIILRLQWDYEHETVEGTIAHAIYRGGFAFSYVVGSIVFDIKGWTGLSDEALNWLDASGLYSIMPPETTPAFINAETTLLCMQALKLYQALGRTPVDIEEPMRYGVPLRLVETCSTGGGGTWEADMTRTGSARVYVTGLSYTWAYTYLKYTFNVSTWSKVSLNTSIAGKVDHECGDPGYWMRVSWIIKVYDENQESYLNEERELLYDYGSWNPIVYLSDNFSTTMYLPPGTYYVEVGVKGEVLGGGAKVRIGEPVDFWDILQGNTYMNIYHVLLRIESLEGIFHYKNHVGTYKGEFWTDGEDDLRLKAVIPGANSVYGTMTIYPIDVDGSDGIVESGITIYVYPNSTGTITITAYYVNQAGTTKTFTYTTSLENVDNYIMVAWWDNAWHAKVDGVEVKTSSDTLQYIVKTVTTITYGTLYADEITFPSSYIGGGGPPGPPGGN